MIYRWAKVKEYTLKECDISRLSGMWFAVYTKNQSPDSIAMELNKVSDTSLEFKHIVNGRVEHSYNLIQNYDQLKGKLDRVIDRGEYQLGYPWWVLHADYDDFLVVYQCLLADDQDEPNASEDIWTVFSRTKTIDEDKVAKARELLLKSGAKIEGSDEILFKVHHQN